jgi:hypothetical protein
MERASIRNAALKKALHYIPAPRLVKLFADGGRRQASVTRPLPSLNLYITPTYTRRWVAGPEKNSF